MKLLSSFLALGLTYSAIAWLNETQPHDVWVTVTTDILTTFCASKTQFAYGSKTYTATASQTLTITDCPCTFSHRILPTGDIAPISSTLTYPPSSSFSSISSTAPILTTITEIVNKYTTVISSSTELIQNSKTYTVTVPTTLTITECPCTISKTITGNNNSLTHTVGIETRTDSASSMMSVKTYPESSAGSKTTPALPFSSPTSSNPLKSSSVITPQGESFSLNTVSGWKPSATTTQPLQVTGNIAVRSHAKPGALAFAFLAAILF